MIPYGRQDIREEDIAAVAAVLASDFLTQGPAVPAFEQAVADQVGAPHAVAVNSATSALHIACLALGLKPGGRVWTSPNTFVASANCALYCGASVDFVDIDPATWNLSPAALATKLEHAQAHDALPDIVVAVHFGGEPCDMEAIAALAQRYGFRVIEDASHAIGARYRCQPVGDCIHSDATVFSFHPVKIITTGEGGLITTRDAEVANHLRRLRSHGITREPGEMAWESEGPWYYQQVELGFNYRMTDIQAALGLSQLARLETYIERRQQLASRYAELLANLPVQVQRLDPDNRSALHLYPVVVAAARRRAVFEHLRAGGIGVNVHYIPVHTQPHYRRMGFAPGDFPAAESYYAGAISLPLHARLSDTEQDRVVTVLREALR